MTVSFFPYQAHCFAFGGFEVQMLSAFEAIRKQGGVECRKIDVWEKRADFDIAHFWGLGLPHSENIKWAKLSGKKIVLTILLSYYETLLSKLKFSVSLQVHTQKFLNKMLHLADAVVVVNDIQKEVCMERYNISASQVHIIPNIVEDVFFAKPDAENTDAPYVLCVGNISQRKNQLALCQAAIHANINLVLIGNMMPGEKAYAEAFANVVQNAGNIKWVSGLKSGSTELLQYYQNCKGFALPSFEETQPISLLEAIACGKNILTSDRMYARQRFFKHAVRVEPSSVASIEAGLKSLVADNAGNEPFNKFVSECTSENVGRQYVSLYHSLLKK